MSKYVYKSVFILILTCLDVNSKRSDRVDKILQQAKVSSGASEMLQQSPAPIANSDGNTQVFSKSVVSSYSSTSDGKTRREASYLKDDTIEQKGQSYKKETKQEGMTGKGNKVEDRWEGKRKNAVKTTVSSSEKPEEKIVSQSTGETNYQEPAH